MARSPGSHAGSPPPKECAVWLAASTSSLERATQEKEDVAKKDLQQIGIKDDEWYKAATALRDGWRTRCREGVERHRQKQAAARAGVRSNGSREVKCIRCNRTFRREGDRKRHKCVDERRKPLCQQKGAVQCMSCKRWFGSRGGLAVHRCCCSGE